MNWRIEQKKLSLVGKTMSKETSNITKKVGGLYTECKYPSNPGGGPMSKWGGLNILRLPIC